MATTTSDKNIIAQEGPPLKAVFESGKFIFSRCVYCKRKSTIFCQNCFKIENFSSSKDKQQTKNESYNEKIKTFFNEKKVTKEVEQKCEELLIKKLEIVNYGVKIRQAKTRISFLQDTIKSTQDDLIDHRNNLLAKHRSNDELRRNISSHSSKCNEMRKFIKRKHNQIKELKVNYEEAQNNLENVKKKMVCELCYAFPISLVIMKSDEEAKLKEEITDILRAAQTSYHWIQNGWVDNLEYHIVSASLPGSGDYSAYPEYLSILAAETKGDSKLPSGTKSKVKKAAHKIEAALISTAQLVVMLSYYLNIKLPFKLSVAEFSTPPKTSEQFDRRVARLNANIVHLCNRQNSKLEYLVPNNPIHNILQLLDPGVTNLGQDEAIEAKPETENKYEDLVPDDVANSDESDTDDQWEAIPNIPCPEAPAGSVAAPSEAASNQQTMAEAIVNTATAGIYSLFRGLSPKR